MKKIGLLGGMSWESSVCYEHLINTEVRRRLGGAASADLIVRSYNFADIEARLARDDWSGLGELLATDARRLQTAGAELIGLCTNTMHKLTDPIESAIEVPFVHLVDTVAAAILDAGLATVGLLGTKFTMEQEFYRARLESHGLTVLVPPPDDRAMVHRVIFEELIRGERRPESRRAFLQAIERLGSRGAQGIIAGCTEIEQLVTQADLALSYFPSTQLHATALVDAALA